MIYLGKLWFDNGDGSPSQSVSHDYRRVPVLPMRLASKINNIRSEFSGLEYLKFIWEGASRKRNRK